MTTTSKVSLVQARYAVAILRVAQGADAGVAARLVEGISRDFPTSEVAAEAAKMHMAAIESYRKLAAAIRERPKNTVSEWRAAQIATSAWIGLVE